MQKNWCEERVELQTELKELRAEAITVSAELMHMSRQSEVLKLLRQNNLDLVESLEPPRKIVVAKSKKIGHVNEEDILWRVALVYFGILLLLLQLSANFYISILPRVSMWQEKASRMTERDITIEPNRGDIYASGNRLLATSMPHYEIRMDLRAAGLTDRLFNDNIDSLDHLPGMFRDKSASTYRSELVRPGRNGKDSILFNAGFHLTSLRT
jgi:hypothetical protein